MPEISATPPQAPATPPPCCERTLLSECCKPQAKAVCCGPSAAAGTCGCQPGGARER